MSLGLLRKSSPQCVEQFALGDPFEGELQIGFALRFGHLVSFSGRL